MRVAVAADHAGFPLKARALAEVARLGYEPLDLGGQGEAGDDYPDFARAIGMAIASGRADRGLLICGSGVGASVAASKLVGVRAAVCHDTYSARQGVEHDDMNVLCLGSRVVGVELAADLIVAFLSARFSGEERHRRRLDKIRAIEQGRLSPQEVSHG